MEYFCELSKLTDAYLMKYWKIISLPFHARLKDCRFKLKISNRKTSVFSSTSDSFDNYILQIQKFS